MHKGVHFTNEVTLTDYNNIDISSENSFNLNKVNNNSKVFNSLQDEYVLNITESGTYHINNDNASKNLKVVIDENLNVNIFEHNNKENKEFNIIDLKIEVKANSNLYYLAIDKFNSSYTNRIIDVATNSLVNFDVCGFSAGENHGKIQINLNEENASGNLKLISLCIDETLNKYETEINNYAKYTNGDIWQKAVVSSNGRNEFIATGHIARGCELAKNFQESRVLLLDEAASGDASPLLLIDHYNVEAGHAASVSRVNEDDLYYLQTRGVSKKESENLITIAFVRPLVDEIPDEEIQEEVMQTIKTMLEIS